MISCVAALIACHLAGLKTAFVDSQVTITPVGKLDSVAMLRKRLIHFDFM
jgi:hypothetical protein